MESSRISLRPFRLTDADDFLIWASDERVTKYLRWHTITTKEAAVAYLRDVAIPHPWRRSICLDDQSIGYISIRPGSSVDDNRCRAHLGYALSTEHWGKGIMTAALWMVVSAAFEEFPFLVRIEGLVEPDNLGSQRVLEKVGFLKEGLLRKYGISKGMIRDFFVYSLLSTDEIKR
ncbi:hypothetical protein Dimus_029027 [Dionaea muscipula]